MAASMPARPSVIVGDDPALNAAAVTPDDNNDLPVFCRGLYVGAGGNIALDTQGGQAQVLFTAVPQGMILPVAAKRVRAAGTTASSLVALW
jgi:hypothetical protein